MTFVNLIRTCEPVQASCAKLKLSKSFQSTNLTLFGLVYNPRSSNSLQLNPRLQNLFSFHIRTFNIY